MGISQTFPFPALYLLYSSITTAQFICNTTNLCQNTTYTCIVGQPCDISCIGNSVCQDSIWNCPDDYPCNIMSKEANAMRYMVVNGGNNSTISISTSGTGHNQMKSSTIYSGNYSDLLIDIAGAGTQTMANSYIYCPKYGDCNITVRGGTANLKQSNIISDINTNILFLDTKTSGVLNSASIRCPPNNRCIVQVRGFSNSSANWLSGSKFYAFESFNDLELVCSYMRISQCYTTKPRMYCGLDLIESCEMELIADYNTWECIDTTSKCHPTLTPTLNPTNLPTTNAPTTYIPTTNVPTSNAPTTDSPTTDSPTTNVPSTTAPTTNVPTGIPTNIPSTFPSYTLSTFIPTNISYKSVDSTITSINPTDTTAYDAINPILSDDNDTAVIIISVAGSITLVLIIIFCILFGIKYNKDHKRTMYEIGQEINEIKLTPKADTTTNTATISLGSTSNLKLNYDDDIITANDDVNEDIDIKSFDIRSVTKGADPNGDEFIVDGDSENDEYIEMNNDDYIAGTTTNNGTTNEGEGTVTFIVDEQTSKNVRLWLDSIGLVIYNDIFINNGFDSMNMIKETIDSKSDLQDIGVTVLAHQLKILKEIKKLQ